MSRSATRFGIYVHIPYCLQICTYCDFVKFESRDLPPATEYVELLKRELETRSVAFAPSTKEVSSIYFGGGTPSLFTPSEILAVLDAIEKNGFQFRSRPDVEITLEINPGTIDGKSLHEFLAIGITRFSVGAQTFDEDLLKVTGRKHTVADTEETLRILASADVNYSFDLLFGLPGQSLKGVCADVEKALQFKPSHLSAYCLTVPSGHPLNRGRAPDEVQAEMFQAIAEGLADRGILRYEVSNFAKPGRESRHNQLYWSDEAYWGLGVGAHSYLPNKLEIEGAPWGVRFWNPATVNSYRNELEKTRGPFFWRNIPSERLEILEIHEALTDFLHTALRSQRGLLKNELKRKFGPSIASVVEKSMQNLCPANPRAPAEKPLVAADLGGDRWFLTAEGQPVADRVFEALTYLKSDRLGDLFSEV